MSKNRRKRTGSVLLLVFLLAFTCGCGIFSNAADWAEEEAYEDENANLVVVGFSQIGSESVWRTANTLSIQSALTKEDGYFLIFSNARQKQENQIKALRSFISQRVDYIAFSPVTENGWETVLEEAKEAGIPVILMDRRVNVEDDSLYTAWIGSDMAEEGRKAGRWLEHHLETVGRQEDIHIVVLQGTLGSSSQSGRTTGFAEIANQHINWHIMDQRCGDFTTAKGKEVMEQLLDGYSDIDVVVSQNDDMTFGVIEALEESGRRVGNGDDIIIISFDAVRDALDMVQEGKIDVDIECNPEQGEYLTKVIDMLERGEKVEKAYVVEEKVFTKENVPDDMDSRTY